MTTSAGDASTGVPSTATLTVRPDASVTAAPSAGVSTAASWIGPQTPRDQRTNTLLEKRRGLEEEVDKKWNEVTEVAERARRGDEDCIARLPRTGLRYSVRSYSHHHGGDRLA